MPVFRKTAKGKSEKRVSGNIYFGREPTEIELNGGKYLVDPSKGTVKQRVGSSWVELPSSSQIAQAVYAKFNGH